MRAMSKVKEPLMTPKQIAEQLLQDCEPAHWVEIQTCCAGGVEVKRFRPDAIQSLAAAYLKTVECLIVISKMKGTTKNGPWTIAREALREMGES